VAGRRLGAHLPLTRWRAACPCRRDCGILAAIRVNLQADRDGGIRPDQPGRRRHQYAPRGRRPSEDAHRVCRFRREARLRRSRHHRQGRRGDVSPHGDRPHDARVGTSRDTRRNWGLPFANRYDLICLSWRIEVV
jgi:hypothetical protein